MANEQDLILNVIYRHFTEGGDSILPSLGSFGKRSYDEFFWLAN